MAFTNIAYNVYQGLESALTDNMSDITVENRHRFPVTEEDRLDALGRHARAALFRLQSDEFSHQASDQLEYEYVWEVQILVRYIKEDQQDIMSLSEEVKYWLYQSQSNDPTWYDLRISATEYEEPEEATNIKRSTMNLEVYRRA